MDWRRRNAPTILLGGALLASSVLLLVLGWKLLFFQDAWAFLLERQGSSVGDFLRPHNEHLVLLPVVISKLCVAIFGMRSARPEMFVMTLTLAAVGALLFVYVRRRLGPWLALFAVLPVLFLGSAWMILLWPFEIEFSGPVMAGLGAMLLLERRDRTGDAWACLLLVVSIAFGSLGLSFAAAAVIDVFQEKRRRGLYRAYLVAVPLALYFVWYAGWGHTAAHHLTLHNILSSPAYVLDGLATSVASLVGLNTAVGAEAATPVWGSPLLITLIAAVLLFKWQRPGVSPWFWPAAAATLSYWLLAAFNYIPGREASSTRYVYAGVIFLVMCLADLLQGVHPGRRALGLVAAISLLALGPNLVQMKEGKDILETQSLLTRADISALEVARPHVAADFALTVENSGTLANVAIVAGWYFEAVDAHGSPAYSPAALEKAQPGDRHWADVLLSKALRLSVSRRRGVAPPARTGGCTPVRPGAGSATPEVRLEPGMAEIWVAPGPSVEIFVRRFATGEYPVNLGSVVGGSLAQLRIPRDQATQPWYVHLEPSQRALVCP